MSEYQRNADVLKRARQVAKILDVPWGRARTEALELWMAKKRAEAVMVIADELAPKVKP